MFPAIWYDFKNKFSLPTYRALQVTQIGAAKLFMSIWKPSASLKYDIAVYNRQLKIEVLEQNLDYIQIGKG